MELESQYFPNAQGTCTLLPLAALREVVSIDCLCLYVKIFLTSN
jgi:hypothetical protein